jgi:hypothetical protein
MKLTMLTAFLGLVGLSGNVFAQAKAAGGDDNTQYKAKTVYDFEDDMVEGDLQRPDGELVNSLKKTEHSSLIEIRKDFIPEMLKSLEDI